MKNVNNYPYPAGDCYEVANWLNESYPAKNGKPAHALWNDSAEAHKAFVLMEAAGWTFVNYDQETGQEIWRKPVPMTPETCIQCGQAGSHDYDCPERGW